ncbi:hypothetical protein BH759_17475 [Ralstonia solanacearum]|nr:hypothetical protein BH759_17475 [Ralstonia solanacearum]
MPHAAPSDAALRAPAVDDGAYGKPAIALHWIIALLIFAAFGLGRPVRSGGGLKKLSVAGPAPLTAAASP